MALYLLDSDAVIDILNGIPTTASTVNRLAEDDHMLCTCDIVLTETHTGLSEDARTAAAPILDSLYFLSSSRTVGEQAGQRRHAFARQSITLALTDSIIAATVVVWNATVVTGNVRDYPVQDLVLLPIPRPSR